MTKLAGTRRARNQATSLAIPRQNSLTDNGKTRQNLSPETLASMSKEQLRAECRKRGQRTTGNKNELLARLGYYKLAAAEQVKTEQRPRNGLHPIHPKEIKSKVVPMDTESLVLWRKPFTTLEYFVRELFILCSTGLKRLLAYKFLALATVLMISCTAVSYYISGPHQPYVQEIVLTLAWWGWWVILGVCSSVGLGTGLHTFLLYLGPHIARVTLAAYECGGLDFPSPPYPNDIICPSEIDPNNVVTIWNIMAKVRIESMMWGMGTALGELPPYFMARAARLSGGSVAELAEKDDSRTGRAKVLVQKLVQKVGFAGILACASIPNPLFDLAGLTCGHFLVPFWTFFGATLLGKAVIKMHIQKMFVIIAFNETLVGQALAWVERIPYIGPKLEAPLLEFLRNQKARLHKKDSNLPENQGSILSSLLEKFVLAMVLYFVVSIVNALAQNYSKRVGKKKGKKKE
ncbi:vacuole membrane protein 1 [Pararge aegeria]|uniref:Jg10935 protein n=4 Tax=Pararge aegeria TaxID=116150 RepID=A0A8S4SKY5_9NEOP|nr:vacuole membrane protein 1 [Pararge aegeria]XP_039752718.1 vacuole membrane protein 1 [Pararge aegeria]CAH2263667.1 jg10935 [Pararge aegeria aegeria]